MSTVKTRGFVLVMVLVYLSIITLLVMFSAEASVIAMRIANNFTQQIIAQQNADKP